MGAQDHAPVVARQRRKRAVARDAGIADHAVVRTVRLDVGADRHGCRIAVGDIEYQLTRLPAERGDFRARVGKTCRVATVQHHIETGCGDRSEEHTSELQSLMRISYAVFCLKKKKKTTTTKHTIAQS